MCTSPSLRGLVYFGASLFIIKGLGGLLDSFKTILEDVVNNVQSPGEIIAYQAWCITRSVLALLFGCLCFHGVEKSRIILLKFPPAAIIILQVTHTAMKIFLAPPMHKELDRWKLIVGCSIEFLEPVAFFAVVVSYILQLKKSEILIDKGRSFKLQENIVVKPIIAYS